MRFTILTNKYTIDNEGKIISPFGYPFRSRNITELSNTLINSVVLYDYYIALLTDNEQFLLWLNKDNVEEFREKFMSLL